ncbi:5'/3'-nucleotidase SurE [Roseospira marina]|uniref:5'-nucleotidase SurE n=1 Tax=Roseospira marina TaxID=140057 RepID=A0A5M6IF68_9PROT|nr:5'/3'-nucleotidase SurE [Roseospira marina]KAA5606883.1 5'/3'-nucleotidase SurE [Roseospira marina]MBB4312947.1 5'-nucleotidase [Roseospira marina]
MFEPLPDLSRARILVSNDDGLDAPGIKVLERIARTLSDDVWVVAPETEQSGAGHSLTLHDPIRYHQRGPRHVAVRGTPTDCVLLGVKLFTGDRRPDLVLSGINRGGNMGEDITYSGTVAVAMEGTLLGIRSLALSLPFADPDAIPWDTAEAIAPDVIRRACAVRWNRNVLINVNFPDCAPEQLQGVRVARQGKRVGSSRFSENLVERVDPRGRPYVWIGVEQITDLEGADTDLHAVAANHVAVTPLCIDLTDEGTLAEMETAF